MDASARDKLLFGGGAAVYSQGHETDALLTVGGLGRVTRILTMTQSEVVIAVTEGTTAVL